MKLLTQLKDGIYTEIQPEPSAGIVRIASYVFMDSGISLTNGLSLLLTEFSLSLTKDKTRIKVPTLAAHKEATAQEALDYSHTQALEILNNLKEMGCIV